MAVNIIEMYQCGPRFRVLRAHWVERFDINSPNVMGMCFLEGPQCKDVFESQAFPSHADCHRICSASRVMCLPVCPVPLQAPVGFPAHKVADRLVETQISLVTTHVVERVVCQPVC